MIRNCIALLVVAAAVSTIVVLLVLNIVNVFFELLAL